MQTTNSLAESLALLPADQRAQALSDLTEVQAEALLWDWRFWGRANQQVPPGDWSIWVILAGRGFGKTRTGAEWVRSMMCGPTPLAAGRACRLALVAETAADARDVMCQGESGILAVHPPGFRPSYQPSIRRLTWPNGATATTFSGEEPDQLRGPQFDAAWVDELAKYRYAEECWNMLQFGMRLGSDPRQVVTTTPRPIPVLKQLLQEPGVIVTKGSTFDNRSNLAPKFLQTIERKYAGTRLGRQELEAEILDDSPDSLWRRAKLDEQRLYKAVPGSQKAYVYKGKPFDLPAMKRIVVAVDPAAEPGGEGEASTGAETGIIVIGLGVDGRAYVLGDVSCSGDPNTWASAAVSAFDLYDADIVVVETNNGGAMVKDVLRSRRKTIPVMEVKASRGKVTRAEPVSALYEQGRVSHVGSFPGLEDQMVVFTPFGIIGATTADRVDALVWGCTQLFPGIINFKDRASGIEKAPDRWKAAFARTKVVSDNDWKGQ